MYRVTITYKSDIKEEFDCDAIFARIFFIDFDGDKFRCIARRDIKHINIEIL